MSVDKQQTDLPFGEAEGEHAEEKITLVNALKLIKADLHLAAFCLMVFERTFRRTAWQVSYEELATASTSGLWCSVATARRIVSKAIDRSLVRKIPQYAGPRRLDANAYRYDPSGAKRIVLGRALAPDQFEPTPDQFEPTPDQFDLPFLNGESNPPPPPRKADQFAPTAANAAEGEGEIFSAREASNRSVSVVSSDVPARAPARMTTTAPAVVGKSVEQSRQSPDWTRAERHLRTTGLHACSEAAVEARQRGLEPADLVAIADFFVAHRDAWKDAGSVFHAIRQWLPGDSPDDVERYWSLWPTPNLAWIRRSDAQKEESRKAAEKKGGAVASGEVTKLFAEWEMRYGPTINALAPDELEDLLSKTSLAPWAKKWAKRPVAGIARETLLRFLGMRGEA